MTQGPRLRAYCPFDARPSDAPHSSDRNGEVFAQRAPFVTP